MKSMHSENIKGLISIALTLLLASTLCFQAIFNISEDASILPLILSVILFICSFIMAIRICKKNKEISKENISWERTFIVAFLWIVSVVSINYIGFYASMAIFSCAVCFYCGRGDVSIVKSILYSSVFIFSLWLIFSFMLGFEMP